MARNCRDRSPLVAQRPPDLALSRLNALAEFKLNTCPIQVLQVDSPHEVNNAHQIVREKPQPKLERDQPDRNEKIYPICIGQKRAAPFPEKPSIMMLEIFGSP